jgi:transcription elongation factor Elf1
MAIKRDIADMWFSNVVRLNKQSTCEKCGKEGRTECAHIFGRRAKSVRWSMDNAVCLCHYCHRYFTANPTEFTDWVEDTLGEGHLSILREKWQVLMPTNKLLRAEIAAHYREEHKKMTKDKNYKPVSYN